MKILMVLTSHGKLGNTGEKTGFWLEEFAAPYYVFKDAGVKITGHGGCHVALGRVEWIEAIGLKPIGECFHVVAYGFGHYFGLLEF